MAEAEFHCHGTTTRRRHHQSTRALVRGVGCECVGRYGPFIDNRYAEGGLAQRGIVFNRRIWSREGFDLLVSSAGERWKATSSAERADQRIQPCKNRCQRKRTKGRTIAGG